jgi:choline dehydrogenase
MGMFPLPVFAPETYESIANDLERLNPASALPLGSHPTIIAGYTAQMKLLAPALRSKYTAWLQFALHGGASSYYFNMHPLSRGSVNINISSPDSEPVVDYRALTNPVDIRVDLAIVKAVRNYFSRPGEIQKLGPVEVTPGANVTSDKDLLAWISDALGPTAFHPVGTCAKMPLELGGVVDKDLRVHGIQRLSVVDASVIPLIIGGTLQATVYAVAEKVSGTQFPKSPSLSP